MFYIVSISIYLEYGTLNWSEFYRPESKIETSLKPYEMNLPPLHEIPRISYSFLNIHTRLQKAALFQHLF